MNPLPHRVRLYEGGRVAERESGECYERLPVVEVHLCPLGPQINTSAWVVCMSWYAKSEFRVTQDLPRLPRNAEDRVDIQHR